MPVYAGRRPDATDASISRASSSLFPRRSARTPRTSPLGSRSRPTVSTSSLPIPPGTTVPSKSALSVPAIPDPGFPEIPDPPPSRTEVVAGVVVHEVEQAPAWRVDRNLRHPADLLRRACLLANDVDAVDLHRALARKIQSGRHADKCRLTGAVEADQPDDLAGRDLKGDLGDRGGRRPSVELGSLAKDQHALGSDEVAGSLSTLGRGGSTVVSPLIPAPPPASRVLTSGRCPSGPSSMGPAVAALTRLSRGRRHTGRFPGVGGSWRVLGPPLQSSICRPTLGGPVID